VRGLHRHPCLKRRLRFCSLRIFSCSPGHLTECLGGQRHLAVSPLPGNHRRIAARPAHWFGWTQPTECFLGLPLTMPSRQPLAALANPGRGRLLLHASTAAICNWIHLMWPSMGRGPACVSSPQRIRHARWRWRRVRWTASQLKSKVYGHRSQRAGWLVAAAAESTITDNKLLL
jgi:hypothetical protein